MSTSTFFYLQRKPLAVVEGTRIQLGRKEIVILLLPFKYDKPETKSKVSDIVWSLMERYPEQIVIGARHDDGTYGFWGSEERQEKIRRKLGRNHKWGKIPIYEEE